MKQKLKLKLKIDTKFCITDLRKWPISLETQAQPPEIAILSENRALILCCLSEIELFTGNRGVAVSVTHDKNELE